MYSRRRRRLSFGTLIVTAICLSGSVSSSTRLAWAAAQSGPSERGNVLLGSSVFQALLSLDRPNAVLDQTQPIARGTQSESQDLTVAGAPVKEYASAVISIADYMPLYEGDYQNFQDGTSYSIVGTYVLHGYKAFFRDISSPGASPSGQFVSLDSAGMLRQHGFELAGTVTIFDRPLLLGLSNMQLPKKVVASAAFSFEGYSGVLAVTSEYLGVDETAVVRTPAGTFRRCVAVRETDTITIAELNISQTVTKDIYLAKGMREVALADPSNTPLLTGCHVGGRGLSSPYGRDAVAEADSFPRRMNPGAVRFVTMTFRNTGLLPWHPDDGFRLGVVGGSDFFVATNGIPISSGTTVLPGEAYTFQANFTAPVTAGTYLSDWQMVQEGVGWFGQGFAKTIAVEGGTGPADLSFTHCDFGPAGPIQLQTGSPLALGTFVENYGATGAGPFWLEFWGSRTGGLTLDMFVAESEVIRSLAAGASYDYTSTKSLYSIPDGPYSLVFVADRPRQIPESDESNNRSVVAGKRLLLIRPQTKADLMVQGFTFKPNPVRNGQALVLGGQVRNTGTQDSGPFWIEFWGSFDRVNPRLDFLLCESILLPNLAPGTSVTLSRYPRTLYDCPTGIFMVGVYVDRLDQVNEKYETNNYLFVDGVAINRSLTRTQEAEPAAAVPAPDLAIAGAGFSPLQAAPGGKVYFAVRVENRGNATAGPFWLEFWGSRLGGLSLDQFLADSERVSGIPPGGSVYLALWRSLYSIPDGPYTVTCVVDRPNEVIESNERNNKVGVAAARLLVIRPATSTNLTVEGFALGNPTVPIHPGQQIVPAGKVRNTGYQNSGPFWIEFWGSQNQDYPDLGFFLCDSIWVPDLVPGASVDLSATTQTLYSRLPVGSCAITCFADRPDFVNETNEADNYAILKGFQIAP